ncbi:MAG TPA: molybdopterin cofactor-binding domain-containing protein, partial [Planctomycetota bacterium]|nr:molybdopterin cofactor-binding domain-containing protein [Planctomycetota bacterium]
MSLPWLADPFDPERYELCEPPRYAFDLRRRDFLKALGGGVAVVLVVSPEAAAAGAFVADTDALAQDGAIGAFLHVAGNGAITAFTGKAEVGQDIRTSLTQAVAEELAVSCDAVHLVMADTDRVPYDQGTFGSRTTPAMAQHLRRAAAALRGVLVRLAAERLDVDPAGLVVADGAVRDPASGRALSFGELTAGKEITERVGADTPTPARDWRVCGTSVTKVAGRDLVTGAHRFPSDVKRPGMLHGVVLRPPAFGS